MSPFLILTGAGMVLIGLAVAGAIYAGLATWATWRFTRQKPTAPIGRPAISVLKPLHGDEPELYENLKSFCDQSYAGTVRIILGVQDSGDPALAVAERLKGDHLACDIVVVSDPTLHGTNRKLGNLINMSGHANGEIVVISDSDVRLPAGGLGQIVAALEQPDVGLVHCLYRGRPTASPWSKIAAMDVNTRFAASVLVGETLGANPCLGPTMALRTETLAAIGGLQHLADFLADDFELGRAVRAQGLEIACPPMVIDHVFPERSAQEVWAHELRWARTIRLVQPAGYLGSVIVHFTPLALIGSALTGFSDWSLAMLAALVLFRQAQAHGLSRMLGGERGLLWLLPFRDMMSLGVFTAAIFGDRVEWRGNRLRVQRDGVITAT
ncbi:MAG TPA: bacteriohopanetetrol glucosamine biosynthesis glycosyltransferase HpnI [Caulobacteraceae bacterium]|nr:bacteriohopanetetrol glucosamine biosynthesis glycosyltransferase HpnI [Caulobacteraceae bacterium]